MQTSTERLQSQPLPTIGPSLGEVLTHIEAIRAKFSHVPPGAFSFDSIEEETNGNLAQRHMISILCASGSPPEGYLVYIKNLPPSIPWDIPIVLAFQEHIPAGPVIKDKKIYLRDFPDMGFISLQQMKIWRNLKNKREREIQQLEEKKTRKRLDFYKWLVEQGRLGEK